MKLQEILSSISLQEYDFKIKKFGSNGLISERQLAELLSYHETRTRNNPLLLDILHNPFFQASENELDRAR